MSLSHVTFAKQILKGSYSRVKAHLLRIKGQGIKCCNKVKSDDIRGMEKLVMEVAENVRSSLPKDVPLPSATTSQSQSALSMVSSSGSFRQQGYEPRKRKALENSALEKAFQMQKREELKEEISRMFYSAGLPFHLARNPHYIRAFTLACEINLDGFVPPGYNMLRTTLLQKEKANIEMLLQLIKDT